MFNATDGSPSFPKLEEDVLKFWKENDVYHRSLAQREGAPPFVFYEGPPTANGMPHPGHCLTRAIKDLFPRYKTMRGYRCERKAGWDTHGLPVEVEVCKALTEELGRPVHSKEDIEEYGVEPFIQKCQASVWRYMQEWERLTERLGFWVDLDKAYVTYHQSYVESVWWSLKTLFDRDLLYQGHKIVWWWAQGGTALSSGEVGQGYREVADPSVYVKFPLVDEGGEFVGKSLLVWTTTPWTLPSNHYAAVNTEIEYSTVADERTGEHLIIASDLVETVASKAKTNFKVLESYGGTDLVDHSYITPFDSFFWVQVRVNPETQDIEDVPGTQRNPHFDHIGNQVRVSAVDWRVIAADFVSTDSGTGIVHIAPAFGEDDYGVLSSQQAQWDPAEAPKLLNCVGPDGKFTDEAPEFVRGRWVKECDKDIIRDLKSRGLLFHQEQYLHDYPFCWRAEQDPLIQYPRESWFIKTTAYKDAMVANNQQINWLPEHIKGGRMGKFLESNVDWALSRERYWGTPLPIWQCDETGKQEAIGSYDELLAKPGVQGVDVWERAKQANPELPDDLRVHKPYIDEITYESPFATGARMTRVTEVIDCWYDSGAMPFAQWGYQGEGTEDRGQGLGVRSEGNTAQQSPTGPHPGPPPGGEGATAAQRFSEQFPADFISEALDQTRGWFYSQLAISTMLWGDNAENPQSAVRDSQSYPHPFKNCIVLGLMLGEDGQKMSKSKRNYREPNEIFDKFGADALRWYLFANQPPWTSIRYSEQAIKDSIPEFLLRLWNCYSFLVIYANIDGFDPAKELPPPWGEGRGGGRQESDETPTLTLPQGERGLLALDHTTFAKAESYRPLSERSELDRWVLSELHRAIEAVVERMDAYDNYGACAAITEFVDALSNWWVRRSRDRFWAKEKRSPEKLDAYWTLYECLVTTSKLIAPFTPFLAEVFWQNLAGVFAEGSSDNPTPTNAAPTSVHLCDYPEADASVIDEALSERMALVRLISSLGRRAREGASLKVRQPLARVEVILADQTHQKWLEEHASVIQDELNVKRVEYSDTPELYVDHQVLPNFKALGKKLGKLMPKVKFALDQSAGSELLANLRDNGKINLNVEGQEIELSPGEVEVRLTAKEGWAAANDKGVVVVLSTELTPELVYEGLSRDLIRVIQDRRKEIGCEFTDRIEVGVETDSEEIVKAIEQFGENVKQETLADSLTAATLNGADPAEVKIGEFAAKLYVRRLT